jgi:hypothetical protein
MPILIGGAAHATTIYPWGGSIWDERQLLRYMTVMRCGDTAAGCERLQTEIRDRMPSAVHLSWQACLDAHDIKVPGPNSSLSASKHLSTLREVRCSTTEKPLSKPLYYLTAELKTVVIIAGDTSSAGGEQNSTESTCSTRCANPLASSLHNSGPVWFRTGRWSDAKS